MPQELIDRVDQLGKSDVQPKLLTFFDRKGRLVGENKQVYNYLQPAEYDTGMYNLYPGNTNYDFGVDRDDDTDFTTTNVLNATQEYLPTKAFDEEVYALIVYNATTEESVVLATPHHQPPADPGVPDVWGSTCM